MFEETWKEEQQKRHAFLKMDVLLLVFSHAKLSKHMQDSIDFEKNVCALVSSLGWKLYNDDSDFSEAFYFY